MCSNRKNNFESEMREMHPAIAIKSQSSAHHSFEIFGGDEFQPSDGVPKGARVFSQKSKTPREAAFDLEMSAD